VPPLAIRCGAIFQINSSACLWREAGAYFFKPTPRRFLAIIIRNLAFMSFEAADKIKIYSH
jgi:hypothetical protein